MVLFIQDIIDILQEIAPVELAESWDNVGLLVGNPNAEAQSLLVALDPTTALLDEAEAKGANVVITHHPAIFHPLKALRTDQPGCRFLTRAIQKDIHVIACHTNLDSAAGGVSDILAQRLDLTDIVPLVPSRSDKTSACGLGRFGRCSKPMSPQECIKQLRRACGAPWLLEAGIHPAQVKTIAVCGGSCSEFAETAMLAGADLFITAEVKHSIARWAEEAGFWIIDGGHFATEQLAISPLQERLQREMENRNLKNNVYTVRQKPPLTMA
ncbi:MAG: Nif3-like dinuclear metal center hexameric protein [Desulfobulbaceae bacterium]|nr:Nif3-like dinuclear metal center hexameric protein [Desulfobulbaceae bacterium]